jgi:hypothetical protein
MCEGGGAVKIAGLMVLAALGANAQTRWSVARSEHFEVYSQAGGRDARAALAWFEQLRGFLAQAGFQVDGDAPVRVVGFRSARGLEEAAHRVVNSLRDIKEDVWEKLRNAGLRTCDKITVPP